MKIIKIVCKTQLIWNIFKYVVWKRLGLVGKIYYTLLLDKKKKVMTNNGMHNIHML